MNLISLRRAAAAAAVLTLSLTLTACGGGDSASTDEPSTPAPSASTDAAPSEESSASNGATVLDDEQLSSSVLTADDLPDGYVDDPSADSESSDSFAGSCLQDISTLTDQPEFEGDTKAEASFVLDGDAGQNSVMSQVESYADEQEVVSAIAQFSDVVGGCTEAKGTDPDGTAYDLTLQSDQTVSLDGVDEQARVAIKGTITTGGLELPVYIGYNVARIANNIVVISTFDAGDVAQSIVEQTDALTQVSVDRLVEVTG